MSDFAWVERDRGPLLDGKRYVAVSRSSSTIPLAALVRGLTDADTGQNLKFVFDSVRHPNLAPRSV